MSYQIIPNILFIFAVLGILLIILRRLPEAVREENKQPQELPPEANLHKKGLPAVAISRFNSGLKLWLRRFWNFILEAKDLKPGAISGYNIKKIFGGRRHNPGQAKSGSAQNLEDVKSEKFFLEAIKNEPKNYSHYDALGKFYLDGGNFADAKDIYRYLANHQPSNGDFAARLAYSYYRLGQYDQAAAFYQRSLALDSAQPNRYYNLGLSWDALGQDKQAEQALLKAISLEPKNSKYFISLSNVYLKLGETAKAKEKLQAAQKFDPGNESVLAKLESLNVKPKVGA